MDRRRYLALLGTGAAAGCLAAPVPSEQGRGTADDEDGRSSDGENEPDNDPYGGENVEYYRHDLGEWFDLDDAIAAVVTGTERVEAEDAADSDEDVYIVELRLENQTDEPVTLEHAPFWLEQLGYEHPPDTSLSEPLSNGATGATTSLESRERRRLKLTFNVPDDVEPEYLWVNAHYICLVP